jgi:hypothetical protein
VNAEQITQFEIAINSGTFHSKISPCPPYAPPHAGAVDQGADGLFWIAGEDEKTHKLKWFRFPSGAQVDVGAQLAAAVDDSKTPAERAAANLQQFGGYLGGSK